MAISDPVRLGSAARPLLVESADNKLRSDLFGIFSGSIRYQVAFAGSGGGGDGVLSGPVLTPGTPYTGGLPLFLGCLVDDILEVNGLPGRAAVMDVTYAKINPNFKVIPEVGSALQFIDVSSAVPPATSTTNGEGANAVTTTISYVFPPVSVRGIQLIYRFAVDRLSISTGIEPGRDFNGQPENVKLQGLKITAQSGATNSFTSEPATATAYLEASGFREVSIKAEPCCGGKLWRVAQSVGQFYQLVGLSLGG